MVYTKSSGASFNLYLVNLTQKCKSYTKPSNKNMTWSFKKMLLTLMDNANGHHR